MTIDACVLVKLGRQGSKSRCNDQRAHAQVLARLCVYTVPDALNYGGVACQYAVGAGIMVSVVTPACYSALQDDGAVF